MKSSHVRPWDTHGGREAGARCVRISDEDDKTVGVSCCTVTIVDARVNKEGIIHGCRRVPTTCVIFREGSWPCVALVADRFGRMNVGTVFGWVFLSHQIEAALASYLGGVARDSFGNYTAAFLGAGILAVMAAMMALLVRRRPASASPAEARS